MNSVVLNNIRFGWTITSTADDKSPVTKLVQKVPSARYPEARTKRPDNYGTDDGKNFVLRIKTGDTTQAELVLGDQVLWTPAVEALKDQRNALVVLYRLIREALK